MQRKTWLLFGAALLVLAGLTAQVPVVAWQSQATYDLSWSTIDSGGYTFSTGGTYTLGGTAGQPDAGLLSGGPYTLGGGFWQGGATAAAYRIYLPVIMRGF